MDLRNKTQEQPAKVRATNFKEVSLGFDKETAKKEALRCLGCKNPPCRKGCPVGIDIPGFINFVKSDDLDKAAEVLFIYSNLPAVCGRVCPQENQCEKYCVRNNEKMGGSVSIGALERYVGDYAVSKNILPKKPEPNGLKAAVIGSGPSGLTAAYYLAMGGFKVTVFEALHEAGGVLVYGIPEFRLPKSLVKSEIDKLYALDVEIKLNTVIGKTMAVEELIENFDAVFIGTGAGLPMFLNIEGENLNGVFSANEFLTRVNLMKAYEKDSPTPVKKGENVIVVGAGNVAMDAARTALRLGAKSVTVVYRRSEKEMPARKEEVVHAKEEGIKFEFLASPVKLLGDKNVEKAVIQRFSLGEPDASGRRRPVPIEGSEYTIDCDEVIIALGTSPNPLIKNSCKRLSVTEKGTIIVNEDLKTSIDKVYAGGDAVTGAATVILAMGAGKKAAESIIEYFKKGK